MEPLFLFLSLFLGLAVIIILACLDRYNEDSHHYQQGSSVRGGHSTVAHSGRLQAHYRERHNDYYYKHFLITFRSHNYMS